MERIHFKPSLYHSTVGLWRSSWPRSVKPPLRLQLTRAPTGVWANFARRGGADDRPPPRRSRKLSNVARSGKRHSKALEKVYRKYFGHFFSLRSKMTSREVTKGQILPQSQCVRHFPTNDAVARELQGLGGRGKNHSITLLQTFPQFALRFDLRSTVWPPEAMKGQNGRILKIFFLS